MSCHVHNLLHINLLHILAFRNMATLDKDLLEKTTALHATAMERDDLLSGLLNAKVCKKNQSKSKRIKNLFNRNIII